MANLFNKELSKIENEIAIFDGNNCFPYETKFTINLNEKSDIGAKELNFKISDGINEILKGKCSNFDISLYTQDNRPVFYMKSNPNNNHEIKEIFKDENQHHSISTIQSKSSNSNKLWYKVDFVNLAKEEKEYFEMMSDNELQNCDILYNGDKQDYSPIVSKIIRNGNSCEVKITSNVDYIFIIGLASLFFSEKILLNNGQNSPTNSYDNIARLNMPTTPMMSHMDNKSTDVLLHEQDQDCDVPQKNPKKFYKKRKPLCVIIPSILFCCYCCDMQMDCCCCRRKDCCCHLKKVPTYQGQNRNKKDTDGCCDVCEVSTDLLFDMIEDTEDNGYSNNKNDDCCGMGNNDNCCCCCDGGDGCDCNCDCCDCDCGDCDCDCGDCDCDCGDCAIM